MRKAEAIRLLGGTNSSAAALIGITQQAVSQWPDELPATISDRVQAALCRLQHGVRTDPTTGPGALDEAEQGA